MRKGKKRDLPHLPPPATGIARSPAIRRPILRVNDPTASGHRTLAVLEEARGWQEIGAGNRDSQLVETGEMLVSQVARSFGVPPLIGQPANTNHRSLAAPVSV